MKLSQTLGVTTLLIGLLAGAIARQAAPKQYAIFFYEPKAAFADRTNANAKQYWENWTSYIGGIQQSGKLDSGSALLPPEIGAKLTKSGEAKLDTSKLNLSGFLVIHEETYAAALKLAKASPAIAEGGAVEVREVLPMGQHNSGAR